MADLTPLTIAFEFLPPVLVTFAYLLVFRGRRNRYIEAFVLLMYIKTVTFFLYAVYMQTLTEPIGFDPGVDAATLSWMVLLDFLFQFMYSLQEFLTWIMVTFFAVLFGMAVLFLKMALQDPLKMRFSNLIARLVGKAPESDGYSGFRERLRNVRFEGVPEHPLDPEVQKKAWSGAWRDYLIIGLATLLPSIPAYLTYGEFVKQLVEGPDYVLPGPFIYVAGVLIFITWIYRFGYPSSNRIAKGAGLRLGDRDVGSEMMRGVLGWFFRLNILLSVALIVLSIAESWNTAIPVYGVGDVPALTVLGWYYFQGVVSAAPPILFAIIIMPLAEKFAVGLYKRTFESIVNFGTKVSQISIRGSILNLLGALVAGALVAGAFIGAVMGTTLYTGTALGHGFTFLPGQIITYVRALLGSPSSNAATITPSVWLVLMFSISLGMMLLNGSVGHYVRERFKGSIESFAVVSGLVVSIVTYNEFPGLDYSLGPALNRMVWAGNEITRVRWLFVPAPEGELLLRLAYQFLVNVPMWIAAALFIMYYFEYRRHWRMDTGEETGNLLNVTLDDVKDTVAMFVLGLVAAALGVFFLSLFIPSGLLSGLMGSLINEIGTPDGLEHVFEIYVTGTFGQAGGLMIYIEHNVVRTLMVLLIGPIFWALVLSIVALRKRSALQESGTGATAMKSSLVLLVLGSVASYFLAVFSKNPPDPFTGLSWSFVEVLGWYAAIVFGVLAGTYLLVLLVNLATKRHAGGWWFPPLVMLFAVEYFVYDDQFTLIALIILPLILAAVYKAALSSRQEVREEDLLITYIRFSLMSVAIAEVLSTTLWVAGIGVIEAMNGTLDVYLAGILPHAVIEIPAFLFAAAASIRIARDLAPSVKSEDWSAVPRRTKELLTSDRLWRTFLLVSFFLVISGLIETYISPLVRIWVFLQP